MSKINREKFEAWMTAEQAFHGSDFEWDERRNCYSQFGIHIAYKAFQSASRESEAQLTALTSQLESVVAENAALKDGAIKAIEDIQCFYDSEAWHVSEDGESETAVVALDDAIGSVEHFVINVETTATDAFLAEVRASGVEMMREHPAIKLCSLTHVCDEFAAQLRQGGAV